jgi:pimeloyl-ACP methyl ester carboxylesterase
VVPSLLGVAEAPEPQWRHVPAAVRLATSHLQHRIVLVGHSGAGLLLPVIADALDVEVAGLVFVDSRLPPPAGRSPLGAPEFMDQLRAMATDGLLPTWSRWFGPDAMRELVPDERLRADLEAEMPRLPLSYFEAVVPLPDEWGTRCPCAYLLLSATPYGEERGRSASVPLARDRDRRGPAPGNRDKPDPGHRGAARPRALPEQSTRSGRRNRVTLVA